MHANKLSPTAPHKSIDGQLGLICSQDSPSNRLFLAGQAAVTGSCAGRALLNSLLLTSQQAATAIPSDICTSATWKGKAPPKGSKRQENPGMQQMWRVCEPEGLYMGNLAKHTEKGSLPSLTAEIRRVRGWKKHLNHSQSESVLFLKEYQHKLPSPPPI